MVCILHQSNWGEPNQDKKLLVKVHLLGADFPYRKSRFVLKGMWATSRRTGKVNCDDENILQLGCTHHVNFSRMDAWSLLIKFTQAGLTCPSLVVLGYHKILLLFQVAFASGNWGVLGF